jgi:hypothetical protein
MDSGFRIICTVQCPRYSGMLTEGWPGLCCSHQDLQCPKVIKPRSAQAEPSGSAGWVFLGRAQAYFSCA